MVFVTERELYLHGCKIRTLLAAHPSSTITGCFFFHAITSSSSSEEDNLHKHGDAAHDKSHLESLFSQTILAFYPEL